MSEQSHTERPTRSRQRTRRNPIFRNTYVQYILLKRVLRQEDSKFKAFKTFWNTRRAVMKGEPLFDQPDSAIVSSGLLTPWKFNFAESSLTALGASGLLIAISKMFGSGEAIQGISGFEFPMHFMLKVVTVLQWLLPFVPALTLFVCAQIAANVTYKKDDPKATTAAKKRLQRAYLYYDGAYGLYCQFLLAVSTSVLTSAWAMFSNGTNGKALFITLVVGMVSAVIGSIWQYIVLFRVIPKRLFKLAGYESGAPWRRYIFGMFVAVGFGLQLISGVALVISFAVGIAWGLITFKI